MERVKGIEPSSQFLFFTEIKREHPTSCSMRSKKHTEIPLNSGLQIDCFMIALSAMLETGREENGRA